MLSFKYRVTSWVTSQLCPNEKTPVWIAGDGVIIVLGRGNKYYAYFDISLWENNGETPAHSIPIKALNGIHWLEIKRSSEVPNIAAAVAWVERKLTLMQGSGWHKKLKEETWDGANLGRQ